MFVNQFSAVVMEFNSTEEVELRRVIIPPSANDLLKTVHLRERCFQRNISDFELHAAIQFGTRTEGEVRNGQRCWKFNYNGINYLTDYAMQFGLTAYPDLCWGFDLEKVPINGRCSSQGSGNIH